MSDRPSNLLKCFLLVTLPYVNDIYAQRTTKLFTSIIKSFVTLKVVYGMNFTHCMCTGYCESWILSSLLLLWTLGVIHSSVQTMKNRLTWWDGVDTQINCIPKVLLEQFNSELHKMMGEELLVWLARNIQVPILKLQEQSKKLIVVVQKLIVCQTSSYRVQASSNHNYVWFSWMPIPTHIHSPHTFTTW